jgi:hypothetical protein
MAVECALWICGCVALVWFVWLRKHGYAVVLLSNFRLHFAESHRQTLIEVIRLVTVSRCAGSAVQIDRQRSACVLQAASERRQETAAPAPVHAAELVAQGPATGPHPPAPAPAPSPAASAVAAPVTAAPANPVAASSLQQAPQLQPASGTGDVSPSSRQQASNYADAAAPAVAAAEEYAVQRHSPVPSAESENPAAMTASQVQSLSVYFLSCLPV